jgi:hypothetical protein
VVAADVEERVQGRSSEVEIDENDALTRSRQRDRQVRGRRGLPLERQRRRHHDHPRSTLEVDEVDTCPQSPEGLGVDARGLIEHDEPVSVLQAARRWRYAREERNFERLLDLLFRPYAFVESLGEKRETDPESEAQQATEEGGTLRARTDLRGSLRRTSSDVARKPPPNCYQQALLRG